MRVGQLGVEVDGAAAGGVEVGQEERLVLGVRVAGRVLEADEQRRGRRRARGRRGPRRGCCRPRRSRRARGRSRRRARVWRRRTRAPCVSVDHAGPAVMGRMLSCRPHGTRAFRCAISAFSTFFGSWPPTMRTPMRQRAEGTIWLLEPSTGEASSAVIGELRREPLGRVRGRAAGRVEFQALHGARVAAERGGVERQRGRAAVSAPSSGALAAGVGSPSPRWSRRRVTSEREQPAERP